MKDFKEITFSAPGKVIITGEHAVVYGYPALVAAIDRRIFLKLKIKPRPENLSFYANGRSYQMIDQRWQFKTELLSGCGLGSSAAMAVLEAAALNYLIKQKLDKEKIRQIAWKLEDLAHGTSSGVDITVAIYGGWLFYQKEKGFKSLVFKKLPEFLLINTGKPVETTGEMVEKVKSQKLKVKNLLTAIGKLPQQFVKTLNSNDLNHLSDLIKFNEQLLEELGVVGEKAKKIIRGIEKLGGVAKICGAGGVKSGSGIALVYHSNLDIIKEFCQKQRIEFFKAKLGGEGLRRE